MRRIHRLVGGVAAGVLFLVGCANTPFAGAGETAAQTARPAATRYTVEKGAIENKIVATGKITPRGAASLVFPRSGTVVTITVREGEAVKAGQPLGALDTADLVLTAQSQRINYVSAQASYSQTIKGPNDYDVKSAQAALDSARAAYNDLFKAPSDNEVAGLKASLANAEYAVRNAQAGYDREFQRNPAGISASGAASTLEKATNDYQAAKANLDKAYDKPKNSQFAAASAQIAAAQAKLDGLMAPIAPEAIAQARAKVDQANIAWQQAETNVKNSTVMAPFDGVVTRVVFDPGDYAGGGQTAFEVSDTARPYFEIDVDEADIGNVRVGMPARVTLQAYAQLPISATVEAIAPAATASTNVVTFKVRLGFDNALTRPGAGGALPPGGAIITGTAVEGGAAVTGTNAAGGRGPGGGQGGGPGGQRPAGAAGGGAAQFARPNFLLGMSGTSEVIIGGVNGVIVVPNRAVSLDRATRSSVVRRVKADGTTETVTVEVGLRGATLTEIRNGLAAGDQVEIAAATTPAAGAQQPNNPFGGIPGLGGGNPGGANPGGGGTR